MLDAWETLDEKIAFENLWVRVRLQTAKLPNGRIHEYTIVDRPAQGVAVLLFDDQSRLLMEREYRHAIGQVVWQLPGGIIDGDEPVLESAIRELREETGFEATDWVELGEFYDNPGLGNARSVLFAAKVAPAPGGEAGEHARPHQADWDASIDGVSGIGSQPHLPHHPPDWDAGESIEMEWVTLEWLRGAIERGEIIERVVLCGVAMLWARGQV